MRLFWKENHESQFFKVYLHDAPARTVHATGFGAVSKDRHTRRIEQT